MRRGYRQSRRWDPETVKQLLIAQSRKPIVNKPCEVCGRFLERSALEDRVICFECEFHERCVRGAAYWNARARARETREAREREATCQQVEQKPAA